ncbi:SDR family oxidoreductase [Parvibaculum sedimenti]|uniref:SDR family oxidoreductase n=1 Tax=Parvibaculum sedimenti TaxID=2608632 RepID=A0A6N6VKE4_9HYPH|nr:SDR family oxidoreductase [Parvibaculum sedimenti]KAB7739425.1 SDR family oxidoreductase [Parvibaculum sedimenti]
MKAALITGAARRIGRSIALALAEDGYAVAIHHHQSDEDAAGLVREIDMRGGKAVALKGDLGYRPDLAALIPDAVKALGPLTLLVNNASLFEPDEAATMTEASWDAHMSTNLKAPAFLSQAFAAQLPEGAAGNIVNIIDQRVWRPNPRFLSYTLSKMALWDLTRLLAQGLAPHIRVNGIGPGPTLANTRQAPEDFERQSAATILRRGTTPEEICAGLRFILAAPAMTGQMIALDGGQHLAWETPDVVGIPE